MVARELLTEASHTFLHCIVLGPDFDLKKKKGEENISSISYCSSLCVEFRN
jgi:hypothetical protein